MSENYADMTLAELRRALCKAQAELRALERKMPTWRAEAEEGRIATLIVDAYNRGIKDPDGEKLLGSNKEARDRALILALRDDEEYTECVEELEAARDRAKAVETELECRLDDRRDYQYAVLDRLALALDGRATGADSVAEAPVAIGREAVLHSMDELAREESVTDFPPITMTAADRQVRDLREQVVSAHCNLLRLGAFAEHYAAADRLHEEQAADLKNAEERASLIRHQALEDCHTLLDSEQAAGLANEEPIPFTPDEG